MILGALCAVALNGMYQNIEDQHNQNRWSREGVVKPRLDSNPPTPEEFERMIKGTPYYNWKCDCGGSGVFHPFSFPRGFICPVCGEKITLIPSKSHPYNSSKQTNIEVNKDG